MVTTEHLEEALPDVLARHEQDVIEAAATGRVLVVRQAPGTTVRPDGTFTWEVRTLALQEIAAIFTDPSVDRVGAGVQVVEVVARCHQSGACPVVLIGDRVKVVGLTKGGAIS